MFGVVFVVVFLLVLSCLCFVPGFGLFCFVEFVFGVWLFVFLKVCLGCVFACGLCLVLCLFRVWVCVECVLASVCVFVCVVLALVCVLVFFYVVCSFVC